MIGLEDFKSVLQIFHNEDKTLKKARMYVGFLVDHPIHKNIVRIEKFGVVCAFNDLDICVAEMHKQYDLIPSTGERTVNIRLINEEQPIGVFTYKYTDKLLMNDTRILGMRDLRLEEAQAVDGKEYFHKLAGVRAN